MSAKVRFSWVLGLFGAALILVQLFAAFLAPVSITAAISDVTAVALAFLSAGCCFLAWRKVWSKDVRQVKTLWFLLGVSFLFFAVGDSYWTYQELIVGNLVPLGVFSDAMWSLAYGVWIGALFWFLSLWRKPSRSLWTFFLLTSFGTPALLYLSGVLQTFTFGGVITALYVAFDITVLLMTGYCILRSMDEGRDVLPWLFFGAAIVSRLIFDFLFAGMASLDVYESGGALDVLYSLTYVFVAFGADSRIKHPRF